jgi:nitrite reductase/ring-hydroxylating ferredoxin subunit/Fe-S cluster biogenesis protein NfuA
MSSVLSQPSVPVSSDDPSRELERLVQAITSLEAIVEGWEEAQRMTVQALKTAIEDLNKEALKRLIRGLKDDPAARIRLGQAVADPLIYGVLRFHGLVKEPLQERIERALNEVRPFMATHGGDVELVAIKPPDTVEVRLVGACHGCPASSQTLADGVEKAIRSHCPEILQIHQVSKGAAEGGRGDSHGSAAANGEATVHFISPFALGAKAGWVDIAGLDEIPEGSVTERRIKNRSVLLSRRGGSVSCFDNQCAHLGMPLEMGEVQDGIITCPYHGFQYLLETGECVTAPEVQLKVHAVRVIGRRVQLRLEQ